MRVCLLIMPTRHADQVARELQRARRLKTTRLYICADGGELKGTVA
jgi:hypothetical protein